jgi:large subunit ribosomal protein L21
MSKYAVIQLAGKQFKVSEGDTIFVEKHLSDEETITTSDVLLLENDSKLTIGTPLVDNAKVTLKVIEKNRGPKIHIRTYKSKSKYRKHIGHRQDQTVLKVSKITG